MLLKLDCEPTAKARARTIFKNGKVWSFTPKKTQEAQNDLQTLIREQVKEPFAFHIPVSLTVTFYRTRATFVPKSETMPVRRPDLDNFIKGVLDSLNGIAVYDDSQITSIHAYKRYSDNGQGYITLELIEDNDVA